MVKDHINVILFSKLKLQLMKKLLLSFCAMMLAFVASAQEGQADATALTGTYTLYAQKIVDEIPGFGAILGYAESSIEVKGTTDGQVTIEGVAAEAITGVYVDDGENGHAIVFNALPYAKMDAAAALPAMAMCDNDVFYFLNGVEGVLQSATAIRKGAVLKEFDGFMLEAYTMKFGYMNGMTGEEGTYECPLYLGKDKDGDMTMLNFLGVSTFPVSAEEGGFLIYPAMMENGTPIMFDMASDDYAMHFAKNGDGYKYEAAAMGYCSLNMSLYISSITLEPVNPAAIASTSMNTTQNSAVYNMAGQLANKAIKGIVVKNGKKVVVK